MDKEEAMKMVNGMFDLFTHTASYKDKVMMDIMCSRNKYEKNLDEMWAAVPQLGMSQMQEYRKGVDQIKSAGLKVLRNSQGKHKIVYKN